MASKKDLKTTQIWQRYKKVTIVEKRERQGITKSALPRKHNFVIKLRPKAYRKNYVKFKCENTEI